MGAAALLALTRPANAALAVLGVTVGAIGTWAGDANPGSLALAAAAAALGVGGGNALNDLLDRKVDRRAHPRRPLPSGQVSVGAAKALAASLLTAALVLSALSSLFLLGLALFLLAILAAYEGHFKRRALLGHFLISYNVGALFLFGALAARFPPLTYDPGRWPEAAEEPRMVVALTMGLLALLLNLAREVYKSAEDAAADRGERRTLAVAWGPGPTRILAAALLLLVIPLSLLPFATGVFGTTYLLLLAPVMGLCAITALVPSPARAQRLVKAAMVLGFAPLLAGGLL